jgi:hypothetical protein
VVAVSLQPIGDQTAAEAPAPAEPAEIPEW